VRALFEYAILGQTRLDTEEPANAGKHNCVAGRSIIERSDLIDRFLCRRLDCCGPTGGQPWKRYCEFSEVKARICRFSMLNITISDSPDDKDLQ
jgi:hypothetical protein